MYYYIHDGVNTWSKFDGHRFTVIVLHAITSPFYNVLHEAISYGFHGN